MGSANYNLQDPVEQERIRRKPHEYVPTVGKHGSYVPLDPRKNRPENVSPYEEYPKMMLKEPAPKLADFLKVNGVAIPHDAAHNNFQQAMREWDDRMTRSIVKNKAAEAQWLKENG